MSYKLETKTRNNYIREIDSVLTGKKEELSLVKCRKIANHLFWTKWFSPIIFLSILILFFIWIWVQVISSLEHSLNMMIYWANFLSEMLL